MLRDETCPICTGGRGRCCVTRRVRFVREGGQGVAWQARGGAGTDRRLRAGRRRAVRDGRLLLARAVERLAHQDRVQQRRVRKLPAGRRVRLRVPSAGPSRSASARCPAAFCEQSAGGEGGGATSAARAASRSACSPPRLRTRSDHSCAGAATTATRPWQSARKERGSAPLGSASPSTPPRRMMAISTGCAVALSPDRVVPNPAQRAHSRTGGSWPGPGLGASMSLRAAARSACERAHAPRAAGKGRCRWARRRE